MNILILGSGIVGANLAKKLSEQGKNVFLLDDDANELKNLSENPEYNIIKDNLSKQLDSWIENIDDLGRIPELELYNLIGK